MADDWGVFVDEVRIFASGIAVDRWVDFICRCPPERLVSLWLGPCGGRWHLMCGAREAADEAHALFLEVGFHPKTVSMRRLSACRQSEARTMRAP